MRPVIYGKSSNGNYAATFSGERLWLATEVPGDHYMPCEEFAEDGSDIPRLDALDEELETFHT